jgi:hypothetical protein
MAVVTKIVNGSGTGDQATVSCRGQLVVGPLSFSESSSIKLETDDVPLNLFPPKSGFNFIVTDILLYANKNVGAADATVTIYESLVGPESATQTKVVLQTEMLKQTSRDLTGLNLEISTGNWLNAVTDDDDIFITVMGYYAIECL